MGNYKNSTAEKTTITRDVDKLQEQTGNVYQSIAVISKRANQVSTAIKEELYNKLQEFATHNDNLEEIFENREQIEISKFYEKLPKPSAIAIQEFEEKKVFFKLPENNNQ